MAAGELGYRKRNFDVAFPTLREAAVREDALAYSAYRLGCYLYVMLWVAYCSSEVGWRRRSRCSERILALQRAVLVERRS